MIGANQLDIAAGDGFGPLGLVAQDEQRNAERGRRVALNDEKVRPRCSQGFEDRLADRADVGVGVVLARAGQAKGSKGPEPVVGRVELRVLAGKYEKRRNPATDQRPDDGGELDRFGTRADDDRNKTGQPSP